jgi:DNA-directed RNA polymerase specialized sigma24 family protein
VQETLARAWTDLGLFAGGCDDANTAAVLRAWLITIMNRLHANANRDDLARKRVPPGGTVAFACGDGEFGGGLAAADPSPSACASAAERADRVALAPAALAADERDLIDRRFVRGQTYVAIVAELGLTHEQVRGRLDALLGRLGHDLRGLS